jgi:UDP-N-acetylglucosamine--N-acetylmuramyl-(pentapeptide) pyrophosphoryl-undecaprenol N-acetylglucosamine transferase
VLAATRDEGRRAFDLPGEGQVVLVFGGSQGARTLNMAAVEAWGEGEPGFTVVHVCGERDHAWVAPHASDHYRVLAFTPSLGPLLAAADLVVARAGGSVWEIAAAGRAALLVPYPHATSDHQSRNAAHFADSGAALVVADAELSGQRLRDAVGSLLAEPNRLAAMAEAGARLARPDAAGVIATELLELAR